MSNLIKVTDFQGVFSNANREIIDNRLSVELKNLRPLNGKLVKTFGFGTKIATAASAIMDNLYTYIHDELSGGELYIGVYVDAENFRVVGLYGFESPSSWTALNSISGISLTGTFYHAKSRNPIVYEGGRLRFLPGAVINTPPTLESEGIWLGYIDKEYFDGCYDPTAQFYGMASTIDAPDLDIYYETYVADSTMGRVLSGSHTLNYRFSYIYDGIQESLMSNPLTVQFPSDKDNSIVQLYWTITYANHNKRVTGMKIYRENNDGTGYKELETIDFTRPATDVLGDDDGAVVGDNYAYLSNLTETINLAYSYQLSSIDLLFNVTPVEIGEEYLFRFDSWAGGGGVTEYDEHFNGGWKLYEDTGGGFGLLEEQKTGLFCGENMAIVTEDTGTLSHRGGVLYFQDDTAIRMRYIANSYKRAIQYLGTTLAVAAPSSPFAEWKVLRPSYGNYCNFADSGTTGLYHWFDTGQPDGAPPPLNHGDIFDSNGVVVETGRDEKYIKINGKFARIINGRLLQANIYLDPGGTNEYHDDWLSYSEYLQYDVNPASNVLNFSYRSGGEITGLAELYGNPVVLKRNAIIFINTKDYPTDPTKWNVMESAHNLGNLAPNGYIEVSGNLYVCHTDGIYRLSPNNLAATDSTPTEKLRVSEPIGDVYANLSDANKAAIKAGYNPLTSEVMFVLGDEIWALNIVTDQWREINSAITVGIFSEDEYGNALVFQNSDKKVYATTADESVAIQLTSKTFVLSNVEEKIVRYIAVNYKAAAALTMKIYYNDEIASGDIQNGVEYGVTETPYIDGATYAVTYNGTEYNHGETFTGTVGKHEYDTSGTGVVELYSEHTLPANGANTSYRLRIAHWAKRIRVEITDASGTTDVEITGIEILHG